MEMEMTTAYVQLLFLTTLCMCVSQTAITILEDAEYDDDGYLYSFFANVKHDDGVTKIKVCNNKITFVEENRNEDNN